MCLRVNSLTRRSCSSCRRFICSIWALRSATVSVAWRPRIFRFASTYIEASELVTWATVSGSLPR